ncbi:MAG: hypothetical protein ACUVUF_05690, partial [Candidatus Bathycorpusculaceae bacterium]
GVGLSRLKNASYAESSPWNTKLTMLKGTKFLGVAKAVSKECDRFSPEPFGKTWGDLAKVSLMGRGKRWTDAENTLLLEMVQQGLSLDAIVKSGKFEGRTPQAIAKQMERLKLGFFVEQNKKSIVGQIVKAEIPEFEEVLARYVDAFNKLCEKAEITREDLERIKLIFTAAWKYRELYREYEQWEEIKARIDKLAADVEMLKEMRAKKVQAGDTASETEPVGHG